VTAFIETIDISPDRLTGETGSDCKKALSELLGPGQDNVLDEIIRQARGYSHTGQYHAVFVREGERYRFIKTTGNGSHAVALDIGSTNIAGVLYDMVGRRELISLSFENPQIEYGTDILTRMHAAMAGKYNDIHAALIAGINDLLAALCEKAGIRSGSIHGIIVAGNTVMSHFFLGLDISTIPVAPFEPLVRKPGFHKAGSIGLDVHPDAGVYVFPNAGSYVGGDIISGIIASGIADSEGPSVLVDVGTNAEIVIGGRDWLLVGAGAAGPALEEGIVMAGKRAGEGIIYDLSIEQGDVRCSTFDGDAPGGICGSGMVSLIYELFRNNIVDERGLLNIDSKWVNEEDGERVFSISCNGNPTGLTIHQREIDNFLRSKAAMFTLLLVLIRTVGLEFRDIKKVYVAGALGNGINVDKALGIGMLPRWPQETFVPLGNSSLEGAKLLLKDASLLERIEEVTDTITYKHMHDDPEFMKEFMGSVFLPHTDPALLNV